MASGKWLEMDWASSPCRMVEYRGELKAQPTPTVAVSPLLQTATLTIGFRLRSKARPGSAATGILTDVKSAGLSGRGPSVPEMTTASPEEVTRLVPERGVPIGSLLLLFYPRRSTGVSISARDPDTISAHHEQVVALDSRLPPGWSAEDVAEYLERLARAYRNDDLYTADEIEAVSK